MSRRPSAIREVSHEIRYQGHFRLDRYRLRHELYAGGFSAPLTREVFERGHGVAVLPYDPRRDAVLLVEQFRIGAHAAGLDPWVVELIAGTAEPGESPEAVARREAVEEAGLTLTGPLLPITRYLASPGGASEATWLFCTAADLDGAGGLHGLAQEGEDIRTLILSLDEALARVDAGTIIAAQPLIALQWLGRHRAALRPRLLGEPTS